MNKIIAIFRYLSLLLKLLFCNFLLRPFLRRPKYDKKYRISICGIFKNEAPFLKEWIEFHEMIGVEHFYLYNNKSEDSYMEVLRPYIERELVTLIDWPYDQAQIAAYQNFYESYRHETQWVSFLDIDEFFCPRYAKTLPEWLGTMDKYHVIVMYWRMFGTSGKLHHNTDELVLDQYTVSWDHLYHCGKCLVNTDYDISVFDTSTHHLTRVKYPLLGGLNVTVFPANQFGWFVFDPIHFSLLYNESNCSIQINHYWSKAWSVYEKKRRMTDVYFKENPKINMSYFYEHEHENRTEDHTIFRFLMQLKLKMGLFDYENN
jgi:hypothetical protein